jgi:hypothetical protein
VRDSRMNSSMHEKSHAAFVIFDLETCLPYFNCNKTQPAS